MTSSRPLSRSRMFGAALRNSLIALSLSAAALVGIVTREGYSDKAYPDPTYGTKVPTIGYGSTKGVKMGDTTTPVKALQRTLTEVREYEGALKQCVKVPLHQYEYDAYIRLSHNIGSGAFCSSTIVKRLNQADYTGACQAILQWKMSNGHDCSAPGNKTCPGLWADRQKTYRACMGEPS